MIVNRVARTLGLAALSMLGLTSGLLGSAALPETEKVAAVTAQQQPAPVVEVKIDNFSFMPAAVKVAVGTTVTWVNHDDIPHTVVSTDKVFKSKVLDTDEKFSYAFTKPGRYPYFCSVHPKMTGEVVVQ